MYKSAGFTLIELLVVVLIIGILAAVAVPQYQLAVAKSQYGAVMGLVNSFADAQERYKLANGAFADNFEALDLSLPGDFTCQVQSVQFCSNGKIILFIDQKSIFAALGKVNNSDPRYGVHYQYNRKRICMANTGSDLWNKVCRSLGGVLDPNAGSSVSGIWNEYILP